MTKDEARFKSARAAGDVYVSSFRKLGREVTTEIAKGSMESAAGALAHLEGDAAAYFFAQQLADHIARRLIDDGQVNFRGAIG